MLNTRKTRLAVGLALTAAMGASLVAGSANADPAQYSAFVGVGSDTIQDIMNASAGNSNGISYTPISSSAATGRKQVISFDASVPAGVADTCVTTKLGGASFTRPNGSTGGRKALYASSGLSTVGWTGVAIGGLPTCATAVDVSGAIDFARSSSGPAAGDLATDITYIPFGRDALSFGYYRASGAPVTTLTKAQLTSLFSTGPATIGGVLIYPCGIQTSSGTFSFWNTALGITTAIENTGTTACNNLLGTNVRSQESDAAALKARGDAAGLPAGAQVIVGFSAASFIAQGNGVAAGTVPSSVNVGIGAIDNGGTLLGVPVTGTAPTLAPSTTYYADTTFGRNVYNVLPTSVAVGSVAQNLAIKSLFVGTTSALCSATATINTFGFLPIATCGSTGLKGAWITGAT